MDNVRHGRQYRLRKLTTSNRTGDVFGITIPYEVASRFPDCSFWVSRSGTSIVLQSGAEVPK